MDLSKKHRQALERIFQDPVSGTIRWNDIENLFKAVGAEISEGAGSRVRINFGKFLSVYHRPHPRKETVKGAVESVRKDLRRLGITPEEMEK
jgi:hypothetical protein